MKNEELSRGQFLKQMGLSTKALMAFYCMGAISACSTEDPEPIDNTPDGNTGNEEKGFTGTTTGSSINFTVDLTHKDFSKLKTDGEYAYVADIIIANTGNGFLALSKKCTHQGTTIEYRSGSKDFRCPNHGSEFSQDGSVTKSPASSPLTTFTTTLSADSNSLTVKA